ncbi:molecular chaperone [Salmonella enterica subsp. enterica]|uniref:Molecular chaperone n=1 Tax=Salmonella enterica I TaxID=59201 RepID=A0A3S4LWU8_SALET|nr:molecular chaperone [Salmonella enterica subsp. enterica]
MSVPGWKEEELEIETVGGNLNITGKHTEETVEDQTHWIYRGIRKADFPVEFFLCLNMLRLNNCETGTGPLVGRDLPGDP